MKNYLIILILAILIPIYIGFTYIHSGDSSKEQIVTITKIGNCYKNSCYITVQDTTGKIVDNVNHIEVPVIGEKCRLRPLIYPLFDYNFVCIR